VKKIDGRTSKQERAKILQRPAEVLIGQIDATNEGLNLQAYKEIYMVSPHWNPAVEDQAIARCHRIGQTEEVHVFHFLMTGFGNDESTVDAEEEAITLDQYICNVQQVKRSIVKNILDID
jgi:superfamily II DNA or RNA helicase